MKKIQILTTIMIIAIFIFIPKNTKAYNENDQTSEKNEINTDIILEEQQSNFGIRDFLKEAENYSPDFVKDLDISNIFNSALTGKIDNSNILKKILNLAGVQVLDTLKILINILLIVLIHSILKSITDGLENGEVSKIVYYVQYVLIVTIIMANFTDILKSVEETIENLVGFSGSLVPLLVTLMTYTGSITTTAVIEPILLFMIEFITNMIKTLVIPIISIITVLIIISKITDKVQISKLGNFLKSSVVWALGIILTTFVGVVSLEGSLCGGEMGTAGKYTVWNVEHHVFLERRTGRRRDVDCYAPWPGKGL